MSTRLGRRARPARRDALRLRCSVFSDSPCSSSRDDDREAVVPAAVDQHVPGRVVRPVAEDLHLDVALGDCRSRRRSRSTTFCRELGLRATAGCSSRPGEHELRRCSTRQTAAGSVASQSGPSCAAVEVVGERASGGGGRAARRAGSVSVDDREVDDQDDRRERSPSRGATGRRASASVGRLRRSLRRSTSASGTRALGLGAIGGASRPQPGSVPKPAARQLPARARELPALARPPFFVQAYQRLSRSRSAQLSRRSTGRAPPVAGSRRRPRANSIAPDHAPWLCGRPALDHPAHWCSAASRPMAISHAAQQEPTATAPMYRLRAISAPPCRRSQKSRRRTTSEVPRPGHRSAEQPAAAHGEECTPAARGAPRTSQHVRPAAARPRPGSRRDASPAAASSAAGQRAQRAGGSGTRFRRRAQHPQPREQHQQDADPEGSHRVVAPPSRPGRGR